MRTLRNKIISLVLSLAILTNMVGCSNNKNDSKEEPSIIASSNIDNGETTKEPEVVPELDEKNLEDKNELVEIDITPFIDKLNEINPEYNHQEFYHNSESIEHILEVANTYSECPSEEVLNIDELVDCIIENSNAYENSPFIIKQDMDKVRYLNFGTALRRALNNLANELNEEDFCRLKNYSIVDGNLSEYGEGTLGLHEGEKNLISIDYEILQVYYLLDEVEFATSIDGFDYGFIEYLTKTIQHELNHAREWICQHRIDNGQINENIAYNGLLTIIEAGAESQLYSNDVNNDSNFVIYNEIDTFDYTYYDERLSQRYLMLMGMFKEDFSLEKYYECLFNGDLPSFYKMYGFEDIDDYKEFYNIIYALDTLNVRTELISYIRLKNLSLSKGIIDQEVGTTYRIYMFRNIIKDLISRINKKDISFDEGMYLYNYVKSHILSDAENLQFLEDGSYLKDEEGIGIFVYEEEFVNSILDIEKIFYEFVCEFYGATLDDITHFDKKRRDLNNILDYELMSMTNVLYEDEEVLLSILNKFPIIKEISFTKKCFEFEIGDFEEYVNGKSRTRTTNIA